jgi:hypothetical protein
MAENSRGGQELPEDVQDRPEQNAGYDEAVRGGESGTPADLDVMTQDERVPLDGAWPDEGFLDETAHRFGDLG